MNTNAVLQTLDIKEKRVHILSEYNMRWYFGTQVISLTGLMMRTSILALLLIEIVGPTRAPFWIGLVASLNLIPGTFLSIFVGFFLDVYDKRRVLQITAFLGILQACGFAYLAYRHPDLRSIPLSGIVFIAAFSGLTNAVDGLCRNAIIKDALVNRYNDRIGATMFASLYTVAMIVGSGLAGYSVIYIGYANSFILNALSYIVLIFGLHMMNFDHHVRTHKNLKGMMQKIRHGMIYTFKGLGLRLCIILAVVITIFGYSYNVILPIIAKEMFNGGPKEYSYLAAIAGAGSLLGSLCAIFWSERRPVKFIVTGTFIIGLAHLGFVQMTDIHEGAIFLFLCGFGFMAGFAPIRGAIYHLAKKRRIGIVLGVLFTFFYGGMALSSFGSGWLVGHFGSRAVLMCCGIALVITASLIPFLPGIKELEYVEVKA
ncbi:MAG: MFS transporter [Candidatus Pacebacteria bacterium]|nr:MFS transporter [Candidatus Paceibacterota bacterium]